MGFFAELKRRNVVRVGLAYALIAWVLLQAADFFLDVIDAPNWIIQVLLMLAVIGGAAVLIFAWVFEMTPEGIRLERDVDRTASITAQTGRKLDRTIIVFLGLVVAWFLFDEFYLEPRQESASKVAQAPATTPPASAPPAAVSVASVAVLPFVNMSDDPQNEYFSDGLTETLLHMLAQLPDLQVAARTSSFAFKGQNTSVGEIAASLGVAHILEGSVQKAGERVRVTAQLVRANDGFHVWSQNYTRPLEDIFAIQDEIATDVASALGSSLLGDDDSRLVGVHTADLSAYESWLRGLEEQARFSYGSLQSAENHFRQALARDPTFMEARLSLIRNHILSFNTGLINEQQARSAVAPLLEQVRREEPDNSLARALELNLELYNAIPERGSEGALEIIDELRGLLAVLPTETYIRLSIAGMLTNFFKEYEQAEQVVQAGLLIDPLAANLHGALGDVYNEAGRLEESRAAYLKSLELEPDNPNTYFDLRDLEKRLNNLPAALDWGRRATEVDPQDHELAAQMAWDLYRLGLPEEGDHWTARVIALAPGSAMAFSVEYERALARSDLEQAVAVAQEMIVAQPPDRQGAFGSTVFGYGSLMSRLGRSREAYDFLAATRPDIVDYSQLTGDLQGIIIQFVSLFLLAELEPPETVLPAWQQLTANFDRMGFPWRQPEDSGPTFDLVMHGDTEAAIESYLSGPLQRSLARNLTRLHPEFPGFMSDVYADPRVVARLGEMEEEYQQVRKDVIAMLQRPEWSR